MLRQSLSDRNAVDPLVGALSRPSSRLPMPLLLRWLTEKKDANLRVSGKDLEIVIDSGCHGKRESRIPAPLHHVTFPLFLTRSLSIQVARRAPLTGGKGRVLVQFCYLIHLESQ